MTISIGDSLPDVQIETNEGTRHLTDFSTKPLVMYFYPKDNTPGCTTESKDFRDLYADFQAKGAEILGVSRDSLRSHQSFRSKFDLPFLLISDSDETLCNTFDVIKLKKLYGKEYMGIDRSTFLFTAESKLAQQWRSVKVADHAQKVLDALTNL